MSSLFHYTRLSTLLEYILPSRTLRTNNLNAMNDPRESGEWAFGGTNVPYEEIFPDYYTRQTHISCQFKFGQMIKDRFQVICFSGAKQQGWNNEMMWAHYADNQRGVCLEFDEQLLMEALTSNDAEGLNPYLEDVNYLKIQKESPWIHWDRRQDIESNMQNILLNYYSRLCFHKSHFWEKEDEKRLMIFKQQSIYIPIKKALKAVHLGIGCHKSYTPSVYELIKDLDVKLYTMIYQHDEYERWGLKKLGDRFTTFREEGL